ncbi:hypothetical protein [Paraflavitalea speifideaquila]|uniref:hypothetical protein n=1 Tax=Paraflavitalea speifideaquila TaxID=3076558 RepID=UPI0028E36E11|nr:hypothetical protein [Paraflavitalea speifideiaquila]
MNLEPRNCPACGKPVKGRADKRFCDDYCRNNYNNQLNSDSVNYVRNVNNILRRNRRILEETMNGVEKATSRTKAELAKKATGLITLPAFSPIRKKKPIIIVMSLASKK